MHRGRDVTWESVLEATALRTLLKELDWDRVTPALGQTQEVVLRLA